MSKVQTILTGPPFECGAASLWQETVEQERPSIHLLARGEFEEAKGKARALRLVDEAAHRYFQGSAQDAQAGGAASDSDSRRTRIVIAEHGTNPTLLLDRLPGPADRSPGGKPA